MKNTIVLKDIESNLIEEAIIVFKENVKIKEKQFLKGKDIHQGKEKKEESENIAIKEAENVIVYYVEESEAKKKRECQKTKIGILKAINVVLIFLLIFAIIF